MIEGFDKEIDSLLRRSAAKGETAQTFGSHLDADEISLFAENALTTKARTQAVEHLAECAKCRKILSNVITFNSEVEGEIIHAEESNPATAAATTSEIPWYRRLFTFPQLTYAMGALVLVFGGIMAVLVLQNAGDSQRNSASVARQEQPTEIQKGVSGADSDGEARTVETFSTDNLNSTNSVSGALPSSNTSAANTSSNTINTNTSAIVNANTRLASLPAPRTQTGNNAALKPRQETSAVTVDAQQQASSTGTTLSQPPSITAGAPAPKAVERSREEDAAKEEAARRRDNESVTLSESQPTTRNTMASPKLMAKKSVSEDKNKTAETSRRIVGGKTFRNVGGIWFDVGYNNSQQQIMIRRGSDDYKRLDSGLRSFAENLGGTVVVVWKGKAYRIQ